MKSPHLSDATQNFRPCWTVLMAKLVSHEGLLAAAVQGMSAVVVCHWVSAPLSLLQTNGGSSLHEAYCIYTYTPSNW